MSGGSWSRVSDSKKKLSERVNNFEVLIFFIFFQFLGIGTTQKQTWGGGELARMSGGVDQGPPILKKNLSERVKHFEVLIFFFFFQLLGMGTTQKQTWGENLLE